MTASVKLNYVVSCAGGVACNCTNGRGRIILPARYGDARLLSVSLRGGLGEEGEKMC